VHDAAAIVRHQDEHEEHAAGQVETVKKSIETMAERWLARKVRHGWDGGRESCASSRDTVHSEISIPSFRSSPWTRRAPHSHRRQAVANRIQKQAVTGAEVRPLYAASQGSQLVAEGQILEDQIVVATADHGDRPLEQQGQFRHA
jgi:hypothetical protein